MTKEITKNFCTTAEAAAILGVSLGTAQNWVESGILTAWKTRGGHRRIARESIDKLLLDPSIKGTTPESSAVPVDDAVGGRLRILVVEDDKLLLRVYKRRLSNWVLNPIVDTAINGFEALVKVGENRPDILIADLQMPHMNGFQMIRSLKLMPDCESMKIVVVTGLTPQQISEEGGLPNDIDIFPKPIAFASLEAIAQQTFERK